VEVHVRRHGSSVYIDTHRFIERDQPRVIRRRIVFAVERLPAAFVARMTAR
jgi:hypothetical protein